MADWADERAYRVVSATGLGLSGIGELIAAALRQARADALEEAARVAEDYEGPGIVGGYNRHLGDGYETRRDIAAAIRALKEGK